MDQERREALLSELNALRPVANQRETGFEDFSDGRIARHHDETFDVNRTRPWKLGWLEADEQHENDRRCAVPGESHE
jgi:hypothetical protein